MARYVIDAATLLHLARTRTSIGSDVQLVAPQSVRSQSLELLYAAVRGGEIDAADARGLHESMTTIKIRSLGDRVSRWTAWTLACEHGLDSIADAEHLALVRLQADALVTVDDRLAELAAGIVEVAALSALAALPNAPIVVSQVTM